MINNKQAQYFPKQRQKHQKVELQIPGEAPGTQELLHEDLDWIIKTNHMEISRAMRLISDEVSRSSQISDSNPAASASMF